MHWHSVKMDSKSHKNGGNLLLTHNYSVEFNGLL